MTDNWFIIQTNPNNERKAVGELRRIGIRVYLPKRVQVSRNRKSGRQTSRHRPLLTGYLLIRFPSLLQDESGHPEFGKARDCQGVRDFIRFVDKTGEKSPFPIPARIISDIMHRQRMREFDERISTKARRKKTREKFDKGTRVLVLDGPFADFFGEIAKARSTGAVEALISVFGRETTVIFDNPEADLEVQVTGTDKEQP